MPARTPFRLVRCAVLLTIVSWCSWVWAAASPPAPTEAAAVETPEEAEADEPPAEASPDTGPPTLLERARQIAALIDGTLEPGVDATKLLVVDLDHPGITRARVQAILQAASSPAPEGAPEVPSLQGLEPDQAYEAALVAFLRLPEPRRAEVLAAHDAKRQAARSEAQQQETLAAALAEARAEADQLEAYLDGKLDLSIDPSSLTRIDLGAAGEVALSPERRSAWLDEQPDPEPEAKPEPSESKLRPTADLAKAQARLDALRLRFLALSAEERAALAAQHQERVAAAEQAELAPETPEEIQAAESINAAESEAEKAASEREAALEAARQAKTEAKRIIAEERARLLGVKEAQALFEAEVTRRKTERGGNHEKALEWSRRVAELANSAKFESEKAAEADPMYWALRGDLADMRQRLSEQLQRVREAGDEVPAVGEGLDGDLAADIARDDLLSLREELRVNEERLADLAESVGWELADGMRDDVVLLNRARLELLEMASGELRESVTGFGDAGVDQFKRELEQITVEIKFLVLRLPKLRKDFVAKLSGSTLALLIGSIQFIIVFLGYLWWRRRAPDVLSRLEDYLREQSSVSRFASFASGALWYFRRIRRPLELLLVLWLLLRFSGDIHDAVGVSLVWITALWVLLGLASILLVDALAARETLYVTSTHDTAKLRIHSLRVVGINVIAVGLILSLTSEVVGQGAIYSWVISTCWILSFPVVAYLVNRWKPIIFSRTEQKTEQGAFTKWVAANREGMASFVAATAAAVYLITVGLGVWVMRQASGLEATRRLLAYLFRREVAKQAAATKKDHRYKPIDAKVYALFDPENLPASLIERVAEKELARVAKVAGSSRPTLTAVVGERGAGKSVFIRRLQDTVGTDRVHVVSCPEQGFEALLDELSALTGKKGLRGAALHEGLRKLGTVVVAVDDIQRLIVPAVNGLRSLDAFTAFAREVAGEVSWVVTIGAAGWHYIKRARGDSVFFEQIVELPHWSEEELGDLIQVQCEQAGIDPSFDGLVVPRQAGGAPIAEQADRTKASYYRLLWDFSRGNPAVALHAFRESLFVTSDDEVVVRLFKEPSPEQIEDLSMPLLFILRTIVQLELATTDEVLAATQLPRPDVEDAMRFCLARGYIEPFHAAVRVSWPWYRTITTVLQRQHLLTKL